MTVSKEKKQNLYQTLTDQGVEEKYGKGKKERTTEETGEKKVKEEKRGKGELYKSKIVSCLCFTVRACYFLRSLGARHGNRACSN